MCYDLQPNLHSVRVGNNSERGGGGESERNQEIPSALLLTYTKFMQRNTVDSRYLEAEGTL